MFDRSSTTRRAFLGSSVAAVTALAGCSDLPVRGDEDTEPDWDADSPVERIVVRSDTGETERIRSTLAYAPPEGPTERPVWTTVDAPADGEPSTAVHGPDTGHGVYSLTAVSKRHASHEVVSFNSAEDPSADPSRFEVVVKDAGGLWANRNRAGDAISIPATTVDRSRRRPGRDRTGNRPSGPRSVGTRRGARGSDAAVSSVEGGKIYSSKSPSGDRVES